MRTKITVEPLRVQLDGKSYTAHRRPRNADIDTPTDTARRMGLRGTQGTRNAPIPAPTSTPTLLPKVLPKRRALLVGINYAGPAHPRSRTLRGCINDVESMRAFTTKLGYQSRVLRDDRRDDMPTAARIKGELRQLAQWTKEGPGRQALVHFSGHGTRDIDLNGDEADGRDEVIVPSDLRYISDDTLRKIMAECAPDASVFFLMDCCHSGSALDLPYIYGVQPPRDGAARRATPLCYMMSGCKDQQTSADGYNLVSSKYARGGQYNGALTKAFLQHVTPEPAVAPLVESVRHHLRTQRDGRGRRRYYQIPQFSASEPLTDASKRTLPFF